jgi:cyclophilin family peptidyl-prolyl cis-trans isomerase
MANNGPDNQQVFHHVANHVQGRKHTIFWSVEKGMDVVNTIVKMITSIK